MSLFRNFLSVGSLTLVSRVAGFARDALMAAVLGTGPAADAFFAAFRFPNLFRRLFAEGAFNTAFVPMFSGALEREGEEGAKLLAARIMSWLLVMLLVVTVVVEIFMPQIMVAFVPGFVDDPEPVVDDVAHAGVVFGGGRERHRHAHLDRALLDPGTVGGPVVGERGRQKNRVLSVRVEMHKAITSRWSHG